MKLTPWFSGDVKPVRIGVYNRALYATLTESYSYWNGKYWGLSCENIERAYKFRHSKSYNQNVLWRGILKD